MKNTLEMLVGTAAIGLASFLGATTVPDAAEMAARYTEHAKGAMQYLPWFIPSLVAVGYAGLAGYGLKLFLKGYSRSKDR